MCLVLQLLTSNAEGFVDSPLVVDAHMTGNYVAAILKEDQRLVKVFGRLNALVLTEVATTTAEIKAQLSQLTVHTESMNGQMRNLREKFDEVYNLKVGAGELGVFNRTLGDSHSPDVAQRLSPDQSRNPRRFKEWLKPITTMEDDFSDLRRERVPGTCGWIFTCPAFVHWRETRKSDSRILLLHGPPGSGKSVLASHIISHISESEDPDTVCIYSYCRHDDEEKRNLVGTIRTAIYDLTEHIETYADAVHLFREKGEILREDMESIRFIWRKILLGQLKDCKFKGEITWVIDGLDESNASQRTEFLKYLTDIRFSKINLKILIVSRYNEEILDILESGGAGIVEIDTANVGSDVRKVIHYNLQRSQRLCGLGIVELVRTKMQKLSEGLFLWVRLVFGSLARLTTDDEIIKCLETMPTGLSKMYERTVGTIIGSVSSSELLLSKEIFNWVLAARRPLSILELRHGLEERFGRLTNVELEIKRYCGGLIIVDGARRVRLLHMTVAEFAKQMSSFFAPQDVGHTAIAKRLIASIPPYQSMRDTNELGTAEEKQSLLLYGCMYWSEHVGLSTANDLELQNAVQSFLTTSQVLTWISIMFLTGNHSSVTQAMGQSWKNWYVLLKERCSSPGISIWRTQRPSGSGNFG